MQSDCAACLGYSEDGRGNFPAVWVPIQSSGKAYPPWVPTDLGKSHVRVCKVCGTSWLIGWDSRDNYFEGPSRIPESANSMLRGDATASQVVRDGLAHEGTRPCAARWFANASATPAEKIEAIGRALAGSQGVLDGRALVECLSWLETVARGSPHAAKAIAGNHALLELLATLQDRQRSVVDGQTMRTTMLTGWLERIGNALEKAAPDWSARLCGLNAPVARRARAFAALRHRIEQPQLPHALALQAVEELSAHDLAALPLDAADVDWLLKVLECERSTDPGRSPAIARSLLVLLNKRLRSDTLPLARRFQVIQALGRNEEGQPAPTIRDAYGHAPACLRLLHTWTVNEVEHAAFHDADNGTIVAVHDPSGGLTSFSTMVVKFHIASDLHQPGRMEATGMPIAVLSAAGPIGKRPAENPALSAPPITNAYGHAGEREEFLVSWRVKDGLEIEMEYGAFYNVLTDQVAVYSVRVDGTLWETKPESQHAWEDDVQEWRTKRERRSSSGRMIKRRMKPERRSFSGRMIIEDGQRNDPQLHPDLIKALARIRPPKWRPTGSMPLIYAPRPRPGASRL